MRRLVAVAWEAHGGGGAAGSGGCWGAGVEVEGREDVMVGGER